MSCKQTDSGPKRFFAGVAEYIFHSQLGVADPPLVDYVSGLLVRFLHRDSICRMARREGPPLPEVADMIVQAQKQTGPHRREVHCHIGDFTLFWVGVYPEMLKRLRSAARKDYFVDYCEQGKIAYQLASTIEASEADAPPADVLKRLSAQFELCAHGLCRVRRQWERDAKEHGQDGPLFVV
jgi:hypothetical protein